MFMKWIAAVIGGSLFLGICCISCVEYTPKPRGYVRIEPSKAQYKPDWGLKNYEFTARVQKRMKERGAYQGKAYLV